MNTKASINLKEGTIELEGSEEFVKEYLNDFKELLKNPGNGIIPIVKNEINETLKTEDPKTSELSSKTSSKSKKAVKDVKPEVFDVIPKDKISLEDFIREKNPGDTFKETGIVIAYYIKNTLELDTFTEGHMEYAYRALKLSNKPIYLRQALTDIKNKQTWLNAAPNNSWQINRVGENFVDEKLPHALHAK